MNTAPAISDDIKRLILARLDVLPPDMGIAIGGEGEFTPTQLKQHVQEGDRVGQMYAEMQLAFLRSLKDGSLYE